MYNSCNNPVIDCFTTCDEHFFTKNPLKSHITSLAFYRKGEESVNALEAAVLKQILPAVKILAAYSGRMDLRRNDYFGLIEAAAFNDVEIIVQLVEQATFGDYLFLRAAGAVAYA